MRDTRVRPPTSRLIEWISAHDFPCVGAKSALAQGTLDCLEAGNLLDADHDVSIVDQLHQFARALTPDPVFVSRVVLFPETPPLDEQAFEAALWTRLQALNEIDAASHAWDPDVSNDPASPHFSMSLGGRAFYVIGLHPGSSRRARRFRCAALVFNPHAQFETLRAQGRYDKLRGAIAERDIAYSGSRNPMLTDHGEGSEARQYSGRAVGVDWACPFAARQRETQDAA